MSGIDFEYEIGGVKIVFPEGHMLPQYQAACPDYDRFLPHFAKFLSDGAYVLDVGANCGDTVAAMAAVNPRLKYECYEAAEDFFRYLQGNVERLEQAYPEFVCKCHNVMVGLHKSGMGLAGGGGTKAAVQVGDGQGIAAQSLDDLTMNLPLGDIGLLKVDVDGYDYDVLKSGKSLLQLGNIPVFFECDFQSQEQYEAYREMFVLLTRWGLQHFILFDNFGCPILRTSDLQVVFQLLAYVRRQKIGQRHRAIYYLDVLAFSDANSDKIIEALQAY